MGATNLLIKQTLQITALTNSTQQIHNKATRGSHNLSRRPWPTGISLKLKSQIIQLVPCSLAELTRWVTAEAVFAQFLPISSQFPIYCVVVLDPR